MSTSSHSNELKDIDLEKGSTEAPQDDVISADDGVKRKQGALAPLWKAAEKLDSYGVEVRGVERVEEHERAEKSCVSPSHRWRQRARDDDRDEGVSSRPALTSPLSPLPAVRRSSPASCG